MLISLHNRLQIYKIFCKLQTISCIFWRNDNNFCFFPPCWSSRARANIYNISIEPDYLKSSAIFVNDSAATPLLPGGGEL